MTITRILKPFFFFPFLPYNISCNQGGAARVSKKRLFIIHPEKAGIVNFFFIFYLFFLFALLSRISFFFSLFGFQPFVCKNFVQFTNRHSFVEGERGRHGRMASSPWLFFFLFQLPRDYHPSSKFL